MQSRLKAIALVVAALILERLDLEFEVDHGYGD